MLRNFLISLIFLFYNTLALSDYYKIPDADFFSSMTDGSLIATEVMKMTPKNIEIYERHYETKKPSKMLYHQKPLIPKVMHQLWDGDIPPIYQNYLNECKKLHPDWEFKFWSDQDIKELNLEYKDVFDKARSYAGKSDIARYEILYRFGGVYRDMDVKCFRSIDELNHKYTFFAPIEAPFEVAFYDYGMIPINNGIIGSSEGNIILKHTLDIIRQNFDKELNEFDHNHKSHIHSLAIKSSLFPLTYGFLEKSSFDDKNIIFPATYFFSLLNKTFKVRKQFGKVKYLASKILGVPEAPAFHFLKPESLMLHNVRYDKREVLFCPFKYGNHMDSSTIKSYLQNLHISQRKMLSLFQMLYAEKVQEKGRLVLGKKSRIPQVIHFIVFNNKELLHLEKNISFWQMLNGDFKIKIWSKEKITKTFQDLDLRKNKSENFRFYLALRILEKFGGAYANYKSKPHQPIFELNNAYAFYAGLKPLINKDQRLSLSQKLIGARKRHQIISATLRQLNPNDQGSIDKIDEIFLLETYKGIYLWGKNVIFPAIYFEPIAKIQDRSILDQIKRIMLNKTTPFSTYTEFTVVE